MIGIIGGTILLEHRALAAAEAREIATRFGAADVDVGQLGGVDVALVQRHGRRRDRPPHRINHAANLSALASLGAQVVIGLGSTGCLQTTMTLPALMVPHDYIALSDVTVFDDRLVHVTPGFDEPLREILIEEARQVGGPSLHVTGIYLQTRGPRLETKAEIALFRSFADCVGMTIGSEATIARELDLRYAALCTLDNYAHGLRTPPVHQEEIQINANRNAAVCIQILTRVVQRIGS